MHTHIRSSRGTAAVDGCARWLLKGRSAARRTTQESYTAARGRGELADAIESRPALAAWWTRCRTRPAWKYTISGKVLEDKKMAEDPLGRPRPWER